MLLIFRSLLGVIEISKFGYFLQMPQDQFWLIQFVGGGRNPNGRGEAILFEIWFYVTMGRVSLNRYVRNPNETPNAWWVKFWTSGPYNRSMGRSMDVVWVVLALCVSVDLAHT